MVGDNLVRVEIGIPSSEFRLLKELAREKGYIRWTDLARKIIHDGIEYEKTPSRNLREINDKIIGKKRG